MEILKSTSCIANSTPYECLEMHSKPVKLQNEPTLKKT